MTKGLKFVGSCVLFALCMWNYPAFAATARISQLERVPMPVFHEPPATTGVLKNGLRYYLLEDHHLPFMRLGVIVKAGSIYEPADKTGLANLLGMVLRTGGAVDKKPEEVDKIFDDVAAEVSVSIGLEMGEAAIKVLSAHALKTIPVFFDLLFRPGFDPKRIDLGKVSMIEAIAREDDYPSDVSDREFRKLVYGEESPWARRPTKDSVSRLALNDLVEFQKRYFVPSNMIAAAAGDFNTAGMIKWLSDLTTDAPNHAVSFPEVPPVKLKFEAKEKIIKRPLRQSYINIGHLGIKRTNPDKFAVEIMNMILGAPIFKSRLMEDVRSDRGLAYYIGSSFKPATDYGVFKVGVDTKAGNADQVLKLVREHLARIMKKGDVQPSELEFAKQSILNSLIFESDNSFKLVYRRAKYRFMGLPDNYLNIYRTGIEKVTIPDVHNAAIHYLHPEGLSLVVVGP